MEEHVKDAIELIDNARGLLTRIDKTLCQVDYSRLLAARLILKGANPLGDIWLKADEVMELMNISRRTLQVYRDEGIIPYYQFQSKILYKASDLKLHLEKNYVKPTNKIEHENKQRNRFRMDSHLSKNP